MGQDHHAVCYNQARLSVSVDNRHHYMYQEYNIDKAFQYSCSWFNNVNVKVSHVPEKPASLQKLKIILHHHLAVNCLPILEGFAGPPVSRVACPAFF